MILVSVGLSHRTSPVHERERAALAEPAASAVLGELALRAELAEAAVLSTCNRTELYGVGPSAVGVEAALREALATHTGLDSAALAHVLVARRESEAARHLLAVAAGLDSMVVGESEIQGQVRAAAALAARAGTLGPQLRALFRRAAITGKRVRRETQIGAGPVSVASVAVDQARRALGELAGRRVLLIGAGRSAEAAAGALAARGVTRLVVANRTAAAAAEVARRHGGRPVGLEALCAELEAADIAISSTNAPAPLLTRAQVQECMVARAGRPLLLIDIAVPRDLDPGIASLPSVTLLDLDDLERAARTNLEGRRRQAARAELLVDEELERLRPRPGAKVTALTPSPLCLTAS